jgi:hypothetical protein
MSPRHRRRRRPVPRTLWAARINPALGLLSSGGDDALISDQKRRCDARGAEDIRMLGQKKLGRVHGQADKRLGWRRS